jgi:hypothetical protein
MNKQSHQAAALKCHPRAWPTVDEITEHATRVVWGATATPRPRLSTILAEPRTWAETREREWDRES